MRNSKPNNNKKTIALLGAGSWGTAMAIHLAKEGHNIRLWTRDPSHAQEMNQKRRNSKYLPDISFPDLIIPSSDFNSCILDADYLIIAVPSHAFCELLSLFSTAPPSGLTWLTKGLEPNTHRLFSEVVASYWGTDYPVNIISGPSFAREVAQGLPTALTLAGNNNAYQRNVQHLFHNQTMRVYISNDLCGVQLCGAIKNVLAIACGISDGLGYGANAKAALITRGLAEMRRLGKVMGANEDTFSGLAGLGDLVLTCTDNQSRNRRFGLQLGKGMEPTTAERSIGQVVEGKYNANQVIALATQHRVEMPICQQVLALLQGTITPKQAVLQLMQRTAKEENN